MSLVSAQALRDFVASAYAAVGVSGLEADTIAELQVKADLRGSEGHGVFRLPQYIRRIKAGAVNVKPRIRIERERAGTATAIGFVDNNMSRPPQGARWLALPTAR